MRAPGKIGIALLGVSMMFGAMQATAQEATPVATDDTSEQFTLVERAINVTTVDVGEEGPSAGDITVWGPDPLYDEANETDTGAVTQGSCLALDANWTNHCMETIVFADGSTLEIQGVQLPAGQESMTTIVGGSGRYLGATGTVSVTSNDDGTVWTKVFDIHDINHDHDHDGHEH